MHSRFFPGCDSAHVALRKDLRERWKSDSTKRAGNERDVRAETKNRPVVGGSTSAGK
jgi:hypothetical protein